MESEKRFLKMGTLIIGAGFLGAKIEDFFSQNEKAVSATSLSGRGFEQLDILDKKNVGKIFSEKKPRRVILCASMSNVDECEKFPKQAKAINIEGVRNVFDVSKKYKSKLVFISTDYVFDGTGGNYSEQDKTHPLQVYGKTKLESENIVLKEQKNLVVRVSTLYGSSRVEKNTFHSSIVQRLSKGEEVFAAFDQTTSPTLIDDVAQSVFSLLEKNQRGVFHCAGEQAISRYEFAISVAKKYGLDASLVKGVAAKDLKWVAKRPMNSSLSIKKLNSQQIFMKNVDQGLRFLLKNP